LQVVVVVELGLVVAEVPVATELILDLPFQHQLLIQLPLVAVAQLLLPLPHTIKVTMVPILYFHQLPQLAVVAVAVILQLRCREKTVAQVVVVVTQIAPLLILLAMVPVLPAKVIMVAPVLMLRVARVVAAVVPVQLEQVYLPGRIHLPDTQVAQTVVLDYNRQLPVLLLIMQVEVAAAVIKVA
jgi:hypothetical protein